MAERREGAEALDSETSGNPTGLPLVRVFNPMRPALLAALFAAALGAQQRPVRLVANPDSAKIVSTDVDRFWRAFDHAPRNELAAAMQEYLDGGTPALREYGATRIFDGNNLAYEIFNNRARYDSVRAAARRVRDAEPAIRTSFRKLASLYPGALFPDVYFVIGRFNTGGVTTPSGIVVAAELYDDPAKLPGIVAHELVHVQQPPGNNNESLLARTLREGSADFIGELISGVNINPGAQQYGRAHEHELWLEFQREMHGANYFPWMYAPRDDGRPNDLGYFIGYRIAQSYYDHAADKAAALREIIQTTNPDDLLKRSGYNP